MTKQTGFEFQIFQDEDGNQCCPDLDHEGILGCSHKGFYLQVLLEHLKEYLDLPAVFVDGCHCGSAKSEMIGDKGDDLLGFLIPEIDSSEGMRTLLPGIVSVQFDQLIVEDVPVMWNRSLLDNTVISIPLLPGDEVYPLIGPPGEHLIINISPVNDNYGAGRKRESVCDLHLMDIAFCDIGKDREVAFMIQKEMELDRSLGLPVFRPVKEATHSSMRVASRL